SHARSVAQVAGRIVSTVSLICEPLVSIVRVAATTGSTSANVTSGVLVLDAIQEAVKSSVAPTVVPFVTGSVIRATRSFSVLQNASLVPGAAQQLMSCA